MLVSRDPAVARVLPDTSFGYPFSLVTHRAAQTNPRVRIVWTLLADVLPGLPNSRSAKK